MTKGYLLIIMLLIGSAKSVNSQSTVTPTQTKIYAYVTARVFYQGNGIIYDEKGMAKSPLITMSDGKMYMLKDATGEITGTKEGKFIDVGQVLNYMAKFGYELVNTNTMPYEGDSGNRSTSSILNTNEYLVLLTFAAPFSKPVAEGK